jgi:hypothetical protein
MNYRLVRQFSNSMIDNIFKFFYKIVDFGKIWVDVFWAFYDILEAFFLIFYNLLMYVYYFLLFILDKSTESQATLYFWRRIPRRVPYTPARVYTKDFVNPVPAVYGKQAVSAAASAVKAVAAAGTAAQNSISSAASRIGKPAAGARGSIVKKTLEFGANFLGALRDIVMAPVAVVRDMLSRKMKPVREEPRHPRGSLIDEYMKEYEQRKRV